MHPTPAPSRGIPGRSPAVTVFLVVTALALWFGVFQLLLLLGPQYENLRLFNLKLPAPVEALSPLLYPLARWFQLYWWVAAVAFAVAAPVIALVTFWVRHRLRSGVWGWVWGAVLIVPPLLLGEAALVNSFALNLATGKGLRAWQSRPDDYLSPDGLQLRWPLTVREVRHGDAGPTGEVVVIEPSGEWRITPVGGDGGQPPLRQGKLEPKQLVALAHHLAEQHLLDLSMEGWEPMPAGNSDSLFIGFGRYGLDAPGVTRRTWWTQEPPDAWEAELRSHLRALVLGVDDLVREGNRP
jgi:hypothetical protein